MSATTVLVIGSTGNIGAALVSHLRERGGVEVIEASRSGSGGIAIDIYDVESVKSLDDKLPDGVHHVCICCGASTFGPLASFDADSWTANCTNKLIAVTRLVVMLAKGSEVRCLKEGGSITVTAGQASRVINKMWPGIATNNAGLEAFVRNAGIDLPRGIRCNAVSPALVHETAVKAGLPLTNTVRAAECALRYAECIFSSASATVLDAGSQAVFTKSHHGGQSRDAAQAVANDPETADAERAAERAAARPLAGGKRVMSGHDFRGQASSYVRTAEASVVGLLAYDVVDGLSKEEYDEWFFGVHYHDMLANPHIDKITLRTVCADKRARLSNGAEVSNALEFYRLAELHFGSHESYDRYIGWFKANVIPPPRTPAGKSAFKFYLLSEGEAIER